jgi:hypothetical protein
MNQKEKDALLDRLNDQKKQTYQLLKSASNDKNAKHWEIDHYLDLLNSINAMITFLETK